jgi:hypothetical protein
LLVTVEAVVVDEVPEDVFALFQSNFSVDTFLATFDARRPNGSSSPESGSGSFRLFEFQCLPPLPGFDLILSDFADLVDFLSHSAPESESDSTSSELFGFFGVFRCFLDEAMDDDATDDAGDEEDVDVEGGTDVDRPFGGFSSLLVGSTLTTSFGNSSTFSTTVSTGCGVG